MSSGYVGQVEGPDISGVVGTGGRFGTSAGSAPPLADAQAGSTRLPRQDQIACRSSMVTIGTAWQIMGLLLVNPSSWLAMSTSGSKEGGQVIVRSAATVASRLVNARSSRILLSHAIQAFPTFRVDRQTGSKLVGSFAVLRVIQSYEFSVICSGASIQSQTVKLS